ncbi:hypothetical protein RDWZM_008548 [Blomia tropicalis]|uniref:Peptidase S1 domain-containing protein n=1 Tax=Blomia tropicalis TaxID=40697 RepID=A0A9Q0RLI6_BLOTA|nr:hypothetical protein RDWZM_008548 [Blomia tropicalis]
MFVYLLATLILVLNGSIEADQSADLKPLSPANLERVLNVPRSFCGQFVTNRTRGGRIIGGHEASIEEFPWQVSLQKFRIALPLPVPDWGHTCGASILNEYWLLTAAHCVDGLVNSIFPGQLRAVIGTDRWRFTLFQSNIQMINVQKIVINPEWQPRQAQNDIALVRLSKPISFNERARPICLPTSNDYGTANGQFATIAGYGFTTDNLLGLNILPNRLHTVQVPMVNMDNCKKAYSRTRIPITNRMICAGMTTYGRCSGALKGDSGSALITYEGNRAIHTGIVSFSLPCRFTGAPDVYTRTSTYLGWIESVIRKS